MFGKGRADVVRMTTDGEQREREFMAERFAADEKLRGVDATTNKASQTHLTRMVGSHGHCPWARYCWYLPYNDVSRMPAMHAMAHGVFSDLFLLTLRSQETLKSAPEKAALADAARAEKKAKKKAEREQAGLRPRRASTSSSSEGEEGVGMTGPRHPPQACGLNAHQREATRLRYEGTVHTNDMKAKPQFSKAAEWTIEEEL